MAKPLRITSRQNQHVKDAIRLRTGRERRRRQRIIIDGAREIERALAAGVRPIEAFLCSELCESDDGRQASNRLQKTDADVFNVTPDIYTAIAFGDRSDGLVVVAESPHRTLNDLELSETSVIAVLEGVEKPGNVGAILRSADAAGIDAVIVCDGRTDLYNPNTIRASLGTVFRQNVCEATLKDTLNWLRERGLKIVAARPDAKMLYTDIDLRGGVAIVLGSEAVGLSDAWNNADATAVRLPMHGLADSLNVSTTAAVLFYEALRQRS